VVRLEKDRTIAHSVSGREARATEPYSRLLETKQLSLFAPVDWYLECHSHQLLGGESGRILAIDNGRDDVRR
jgi:hypothetical protein